MNSRPSRSLREALGRVGGLLLRIIRSALFRPRCRLCGADLVDPGEAVLCGGCCATIRPSGDNACRTCGKFLPDGPSVCGPCRLRPPPFERHRSFATYEGTLRETIILFKYGEIEPLKHLLAQKLQETVTRELPGRFDAVVPVPPDRGRRRGFRPVDAVARVLARRLGIPCRRRLLVKTRSTPPQVGLSQAQRRANLAGAFALSPGRRPAGLRLLLVDDVFTTGATVRQCAAVLRKAGAAVTVLTLGQSPL